jgi:hypothetical protein
MRKNLEQIGVIKEYIDKKMAIRISRHSPLGAIVSSDAAFVSALPFIFFLSQLT